MIATRVRAVDRTETENKVEGIFNTQLVLFDRTALYIMSEAVVLTDPTGPISQENSAVNIYHWWSDVDAMGKITLQRTLFYTSTKLGAKLYTDQGLPEGAVNAMPSMRLVKKIRKLGNTTINEWTDALWRIPNQTAQAQIMELTYSVPHATKTNIFENYSGTFQVEGGSVIETIVPYISLIDGLNRSITAWNPDGPANGPVQFFSDLAARHLLKPKIAVNPTLTMPAIPTVHAITEQLSEYWQRR